jgi:hypothetical protein
MEENNKDQKNEVVEDIQNSESMQEYKFVFDPEIGDFVKQPCSHHEPGEIITEMKTTTFDIW